MRFFFMREWVKRTNELTKLKLNFFTNISHEIRTHLTLIIGPVNNILTTKEYKVEMTDQLKVIKNNSESLLQLVNELMDFRKSESGHLQLHVAEWDVIIFLREIIESFNQVIAEKNIELNLTTSQEKIYVWFDRVQLVKVFNNLLSNALKFSNPGGKITISIQDLQNDVKIDIVDYGKGISKENLNKLFDSFYQELDTETLYGGHGLGLSLTKSLIELHGGTISADSYSHAQKRLCYTCFTVQLLKGINHFSKSVIFTDIDLKNNISNDNLNQEMESVPLIENSLPSSPNIIKILLVEDNKEIRSFIISSLQKKYSFVECENGLQGWNIAIDILPDIIISDIMMPGMDGITLCQQLKTDNRTSHIPVILLTAKVDVESQIQGLSNGADMYIPKPFNINVLDLAISNFIKARIQLWNYFKNLDVENLKSTFLDKTLPVQLHPLDMSLLNKARDIIKENMASKNFSIAELSSSLAMTQPVLLKKIKAITGLNTHDFVKSVRLTNAAELLKTKRNTIYEVAFMVGYDDSKYFSKEFKKYFGLLPSEFVQNNKDK